VYCLHMRNYQSLVNSLPPTHQSSEWLEEVIEINKFTNRFHSSYNFWVAFKNWRFENKEPDPKYNFLIAEHVTYFTRENNIAEIAELSARARDEMFALMADLQVRGWFVFFNAPIERSISRPHFHAIKWIEKDGRPVEKPIKVLTRVGKSNKI
jgi:hypothetical protein